MSDDALTDRAAIDAEIAGRTLIDALTETADSHGSNPAYSDRHTSLSAAADGPWRTITWAQLHERVLNLAAGLIDVGVAPGDAVMIMASNRIEHVLADLAIVHAGGLPISVYNTLAPDQVSFVADHARPTAVIVENSDHLQRWADALSQRPEIRRLIVIEPEAVPSNDQRAISWADFEELSQKTHLSRGAEVAARSTALTPESPLTVLYTSGTTGTPKGVVLTHRNVLFESISSLRTGELTGAGVTISYLPFAHIAERVLGMYIPQIQGGHVHLVDDPAQLLPALLQVRPNRFFGVPRVWEKIRTGVSAKLAAEPDEAKKQAISTAMATGLEYVESQQTGHDTSPELTARYQAVEPVLNQLQAALGLDRVQWCASAAAPMPLEVAKFFAGLGLRIYDVYGMTETTGSATANGPKSFRLGTVGRPQAGIELKLGDDGEILLRGPIMTSGYLANAAATAELLDDESWVHTGDIGVIDDDGFLSVVDRKKEMIITSSGKNLAPSNIENFLKESPLVGHAMAIGDGRPYVVAILTLDAEVAPLVAQQLGVEATSLAELAQNETIRAAVGQAVASANARLSRPEQVKKWELLADEWTAESEELTPTLKLKRRVVGDKHGEVIERLYQAGD